LGRRNGVIGNRSSGGTGMSETLVVVVKRGLAREQSMDFDILIRSSGRAS
jgi:hypothetical protein